MSSWTYISELDAFELYHKIKEQEKNDSIAAAAYSLLPALKNALSGASGTALSNVVTYPLDLVVTRLQVQTKPTSKSAETKENNTKDDDPTRYDGIVDAVRKIYTHEGGVAAFYSGLSHDTAKSVIDSFLFFLAYNIVWRVRKGLGPLATNNAMQVLEGLGVGVIAGAATKALTMPIQNVVTRKQTAHAGEPSTVTDIVAAINDDKGVKGFWSGYSASLVLTLNPAVTFFLDAFWRRIFVTNDGAPNPFVTFLLAANGKATASLLMYPFKIAKSRAQTASKKKKETEGEDGGPPENVFKAIAHLARTEGVGALYAGVWGEVMKGFFSHGLTMVFKERIQMVALQLYYVLSTILQRQSKLKK